MNWKLLDSTEISPTSEGKVINILLKNRGISQKDRETFLHPAFDDYSAKTLGIDVKQLQKAVERIQKAIGSNELIIIYGDYDMDGVGGTCIMYEALKEKGANILPFIPHRKDEGYGLSQKGIDHLLSDEKTKNVGLIITVDNGILAHEAIEYAHAQHIDVIVTDHHELPESMPNAYAIVHTMEVCGTGVSWILASEITQGKLITNNFLDILALSTISDLMPLVGINRTLVWYGITALKQTTRPGLRALFREAEIEPRKIDAYVIGHNITPKINAMGRLESAMDSLRLLCTKDVKRAAQLAHLLMETNKGRQLLTQAATLHALDQVKVKKLHTEKVIVHVANYDEGIIGLVAAKLVETFGKPTIVITTIDNISKASARSIPGFDMIQFIRLHEKYLLNAGGHQMAAGFSIETAKIELLKLEMQTTAKTYESQMTEKELEIDCTLPIEIVDKPFLASIETLAPFGVANPEPLFQSTVTVSSCKIIGKDKSHIKLDIMTKNGIQLDAVGFGMADLCKQLKAQDEIEIAYSLNENEWNGRSSLQLMLKGIHLLPA